MANLRLKKIYGRTAWATGLAVGLLLSIHLLLPHVVNTQGMHRRILSVAEKSLPGEFEFQHLAPALLPLPHVVLTQGRWRLADKFNLQVAEIEVQPAFWPLLLGRIKIKRLRVIKPGIDMRLSPWDAGAKAVAGVRGRVAAALAASALTIDGIDISLTSGRLKLRRANLLPIDLENIHLLASATDGELNFDLQGRSDWVRMLTLNGKINLSTLDGHSQIHIKGLRTEGIRSLELFPGASHIPEMSMDGTIRLAIRKLEEAEAKFEVYAPKVMVRRAMGQQALGGVTLRGNSQWTPGRLAVQFKRASAVDPDIRLQGSLDWSLKTQSHDQAIELAVQGTDLDLTALRGKILDLVGDNAVVRKVFAIVQGARIPNIDVTFSASRWAQLGLIDNIRATAVINQGRLNIADGLLHLSAVNGNVALQEGLLLGQALLARHGNTMAEAGSMSLDLHKGAKAFRLETDLNADLSELTPVLKKLAKSEQVLTVLNRLPPVTGRATGRFILGDRRDRLQARLDLKADLKVLDATLKVGGPINGLPSPQTLASLSLQGTLGPRAMAWLGRLGGLPADQLPRQLSIAKAVVGREKSGRLTLVGEFTLAEDLSLSATMDMTPEVIRLQKVRVKDTHSDATLFLQHKISTPRWDIRFNGELHRATLDRVWRGNDILLGRIRGDMQARLDTATPGRSTLRGNLTAAGIRLPVNGSAPVRILKIGIFALDRQFTITEAEVAWRKQIVSLSGKAALEDKFVRLDLRASSRDLDADKFMADFRKGVGPANAASTSPNDNRLFQGNIALDFEKMHLGGFQFSPVQAKVSLGKDQAVLDVTRSKICGVETPGKVIFTASGVSFAFSPHAAKSPLSAGSDCLDKAGITERLDGSMTLDGRIATQGRQMEEIINNLNGRAEIHITDGKIYNIGNAGFFTNLLSYLSVNQLVKGGMPDLRKNDFQYDSMTSQFEIKNGQVRFMEGVLKSNSINIVGNGRYELVKNDMNLTLLVSPLTSVDWLIERLPIVGRILQGTLVAIPVGVKGPVANPSVIPLSPGAVGSRVGGILKRTLETPFRIIEPILPGKTTSEDK